MFIRFMIFLVQVKLTIFRHWKMVLFSNTMRRPNPSFFVIEFLMKPSKRPFTMQESVPTLKYDNHRNR